MQEDGSQPKCEFCPPYMVGDPEANYRECREKECAADQRVLLNLTCESCPAKQIQN